MSKDKISDYSATANSNTDIGGINIDEGCAPSGINDAIRTLMKQLKDWQSGSQDVYIHPAGSASIPSITATGDTNTGIFFPAADTVGITTGGTERARVDSSGNLGLGVTPSGTWKLDVAGYVKSAAAAGGLYDAVYTGTTAGSTLGQLRFNGSGSGVTAESKIIGALSSGSITSSYLGFYVTSSGSQSQAMTLDASGNLVVGATSANTRFDVAAANVVTDSRGIAYIYSTDSMAVDKGGQLGFGGSSTGTTQTPFAAIAGRKENSTDANVAGYLQLSTRGASGGVVERARIDSSGNLLVGTTSQIGSGLFNVKRASANNCASFQNGSDAGYGILFYNSTGGTPGQITWTASTTSFTNNSDYRLKDNIQPMTGALARVAQLKPVTYTWKADGSLSEGFIAHELQAVVPVAVIGEKDAVNEDGSIKPQGIDPRYLVATLTAAIQEQQAIITQLQADVAALKGQA